MPSPPATSGGQFIGCAVASLLVNGQSPESKRNEGWRQDAEAEAGSLPHNGGLGLLTRARGGWAGFLLHSVNWRRRRSSALKPIPANTEGERMTDRALAADINLALSLKPKTSAKRGSRSTMKSSACLWPRESPSMRSPSFTIMKGRPHMPSLAASSTPARFGSARFDYPARQHLEPPIFQSKYGQQNSHRYLQHLSTTNAQTRVLAAFPRLISLHYGRFSGNTYDNYYHWFPAVDLTSNHRFYPLRSIHMKVLG
jgi:hypothetical protein